MVLALGSDLAVWISKGHRPGRPVGVWCDKPTPPYGANEARRALGAAPAPDRFGLRLEQAAEISDALTSASVADSLEIRLGQATVVGDTLTFTSMSRLALTPVDAPLAKGNIVIIRMA